MIVLKVIGIIILIVVGVFFVYMIAKWVMLPSTIEFCFNEQNRLLERISNELERLNETIKSSKE